MAERRVWRQVFINLINSLKPRRLTGDLIGEDPFGNKYYEIKKQHRQRPSRYFEPLKKDDFEATVPAEWESWLRNRRKIPPTPEEIAASMDLMEQKKKGAAEIAAKFKPSLPDPSNNPVNFPSYGDQYGLNPGRFTDKKDDK